jgi:DNA-binding Lrp family transcriptional regulator
VKITLPNGMIIETTSMTEAEWAMSQVQSIPGVKIPEPKNRPKITIEDLSDESPGDEDFVSMPMDPATTPEEHLARSQESLADLQSKILGEDHPTVRGLRQHAAVLRGERDDVDLRGSSEWVDPNYFAEEEALLTGKQHETLALVRKYGTVSLDYVARTLDIGNPAAGSRLSRLVEVGLITRVSKGKYQAVAAPVQVTPAGPHQGTLFEDQPETDAEAFERARREHTMNHLTGRQEETLAAVQSLGGIVTSNQVGEKLAVSTTAARARLSRLVDLDIMERFSLGQYRILL